MNKPDWVRTYLPEEFHDSFGETLAFLLTREDLVKLGAAITHYGNRMRQEAYGSPQNMELLSGMMRDLIAKVDALVDVSNKHETHINDAIGIMLRRIAGDA